MQILNAIQQYKRLYESDVIALSGQEVLDAFLLARDCDAMLEIAGTDSQSVADANTALLRKDLLRRLS